MSFDAGRGARRVPRTAGRRGRSRKGAHARGARRRNLNPQRRPSTEPGARAQRGLRRARRGPPVQVVAAAAPRANVRGPGEPAARGSVSGLSHDPEEQAGRHCVVAVGQARRDSGLSHDSAARRSSCEICAELRKTETTGCQALKGRRRPPDVPPPVAGEAWGGGLGLGFPSESRQAL